MPAINTDKLSRYSDWRILVYGQQGFGKTSAGKNLKGKTYLLGFSNSFKVLAGHFDAGLKIDARKPAEDLELWANQFKPAEYDNLIIDDLTNFANIWLQERGRESKNGITNEIQHFAQWKNYFLRFIEWIFDMPLNVYITAWETTQQIIMPTGQQFNQFAPDLRESVRNVVMGLCDVVGRLIVKPDDKSRWVILEGDSGAFAKNRLDGRKSCPIDELFEFEKSDSNAV